MKKKIILGSSSKFRESLLNTLNIEFESISPNIDESRLSNENPRDMALRLAIEKAKKISSQNSNTIIISSDACAYCDGKILGKPITKDRAIEYLNFISQKIIYFYTSICVMDSSSQNYEIDCAQYEIKIKSFLDLILIDTVNIRIKNFKILFKLKNENSIFIEKKK